ncbi:alpha/beta hydrolase [Mycoplasma putrefaciens]|uniref:alpha/beta hydrolase n=1 Tax=Mycoplasma putrefaciens TaxID=2123 RepID=UPI003DA5FA33
MKELAYNFQIQAIDGREIKTYIWITNKQPKAVIHLIATGAEQILSYTKFAKRMNKQNIIVICSSLKGFEKPDEISSKDPVFFNYFNGWKLIIEELKSVNDYVKKTYKHLPLFLIAHALGSIFAKAYAIKYSETIDGLILSSFIEFNKLNLLVNNLWLFLIEISAGKKYPCTFKQNLFLKRFKRLMKKERNIENNEIFKKYLELMQDPLLTKVFSVCALRDVYKCMLFNNLTNNIKFIRQNLPILLLANNNSYTKPQMYAKMSENQLKTLLKNDCFAHYIIFDNSKDKVFDEQINTDLEQNIMWFINKYSKKFDW